MSVARKRNNPLYLVIVSKDSAKKYQQVTMPTHYSGTIREESRLAHAVLARVLKERLGISYDEAAIDVTNYGKPHQKNDQYYFSLAHSSKYIACAVGYSDLGVDIEQTKKIPKKLHSKIMTESEIVERVDPLSAWVMKEAYSKLRGLGLRLSFHRRSVTEMQAEYPHTLQQASDYICALFYSDKDANLTIEVVT